MDQLVNLKGEPLDLKEKSVERNTVPLQISWRGIITKYPYRYVLYGRLV